MITEVKNHIRRNKKAYITGVTSFVIGGALGLAYRSSRNIAVVDSFKLVNWKSPHTSETIQIIMPRKGNSGNAIQCRETGVVYPSQNCAAKELGLYASNLSAHLAGKNDSVKGLTFTKITESGEQLLSQE